MISGMADIEKMPSRAPIGALLMSRGIPVPRKIVLLRRRIVSRQFGLFQPRWFYHLLFSPNILRASGFVLPSRRMLSRCTHRFLPAGYSL